jgi:Leucine-rich repeat (LRR) protein
MCSTHRLLLLLPAGLCSLQDLCLDGNHISSLQPLSGLSSLQLLSAAHNQIKSLDGVQVCAGAGGIPRLKHCVLYTKQCADDQEA